MDIRDVDVAVIGSGSAGLNAFRQVEKDGGSPVLIESGPYGTTCARVGCMPSKLLIAAADVAHEVADAARFGIDVDDWRVEGAAVMERVRSERDRFAGFVVRDTLALPETQRLLGRARFVGPTALQVDDHTRVNARAVVVATGSSPVIPPPFDAIREHVMINDDVFELEVLPKTLAVVGTGIIGLELGQALSRLGVSVTFFSPFDALGPLTDPAVKQVARQVLGDAHDLQLESRMLDASAGESGVRLRWMDAGGSEHDAHFERVLVAAGRKPNVAGLDLAKTGLALDERGQPDWNPMTTQCSDAPIFFAGDVSAHLPLLHEAADEGRIAGKNALLYPDVSAHVRRTPLGIAFTDPQMGMVGKRHADLDPSQVETGEVSFADQGRARVMGRAEGIIRVYADRRCCELIGAEMFGPRVEHMAHLLAWSVQQRLPVDRVLEMPVYHPVVEEGLRTALRDVAAKLRITGECRCEDLAEAPGT